METLNVAFLITLLAIASSVNAYRLLYARVNWDNLFESATPPGAPAPAVAQGSYTRTALRSYHQRRVALRQRGGPNAALIRCLRAA